MELQKLLQNLGLEEKEAKVYLISLSLGEATATKLAQKTSLDRTLMYQLTNKLIEKGLLSYIIKNNVRYFKAADPEILLKNLQEKQEELQKALPELKAKQKQKEKQETKVEIYRGREGINTILRLIIKEQKPYYILGGAQEACSIFELENKVFVKRAEKLRLPGKILARKKDNFFIGKYEEYRYIPDNLVSSITMQIWENKTAIYVWSEPYYAILIENEEIAKNNIATFEYLWSIAQKPTKKDRLKRLLK